MTTPNSPLPEMLNRAFGAHQAGNLQEARRLYRLVLAADKKQFDAHHMLGILDAQIGNHAEAMDHLTQALKTNPRSAEAHVNLGLVHAATGDNPGALESYDKALKINPQLPIAHSNLAVVLQQLGRHEESIAHCDAAIAVKPNYTEAWINRGNTLFFLRRFDDAQASYDQALQSGGPVAKAWLGRANVFVETGRHTDALVAYDRAIELNAQLPEAWFGRGNVCNALKRYDQALASYDRALTLRPNYAEAYVSAGAILQVLGRYDEAFIAYDKARSINPNLRYTQGWRLDAKLRLGDWSDYEGECSRLLSAVKSGMEATTPFILLGIPSSPADQLGCAQSFVLNNCPASPSALWNGERYAHDRVRMAYLSGDFHEHAVAHLIVGMFEHHDRARFEITGISFGLDQESAFRNRLRGSFDRFIEARERTDEEIAKIIRELEIDIAVDLVGHTRGARTNIFSMRPAPVQVNFLGYPGTMGADYIDYIIADQTIIPASDAAAFSEKIIYLPDTYQPTDSKRPISEQPLSREDVGLPATGFVFCSFNTIFKITPSVFDIWMRLLDQVEGSVLWLRDENRPAVNNLRREAEARGVSAGRLIFAPFAPSDIHLARHRLADLALDTLPYNAHATASDALWAGTPIITQRGSAFAGRVAASLLSAAGLPELITHSPQEYETLALKLAREPDLLAAVKQKIAQNRTTFPLFDTERYTRNIEAAFAAMLEARGSG